MNKKDSPYTAAITGGGFLFDETNILLPLLRDDNAEDLLREEGVNNKLLHINAESSRLKAILEIKRRYETMPPSFWNDFLEMSNADKIIALFYVILKTYKICFDFHVNVTMKKWKSISKSIEKNDIMLSEYQERLVNDCIDALNKYFPDKMKNVDKDNLRQFISLNLPKK